MAIEDYSEGHVNLVAGLETVYHSLRMYCFSLIASLSVSATTTLLLIVYSVNGDGLHIVVGRVFTVLVCLVAVDAVSLIFFAMWTIDFIEILDSYTSFCRRSGRCIDVFEVDESSVAGLIDYPLWLIILYVVSVTFTSSAAYILMVLIRYGFVGGPLTYREGVLASDLLYVLGFIVGALASLLIVLLLSKLSEYTGIRLLYVTGLSISLKYLVDLVSLVYSMSLAANIIGIILTGSSLYHIVKLSKSLLIAWRPIVELKG